MGERCRETRCSCRCRGALGSIQLSSVLLDHEILGSILLEDSLTIFLGSINRHHAPSIDVLRSYENNDQIMCSLERKMLADGLRSDAKKLVNY